MTVTHEEAKANPERYRILESGAIYGLEEGHIVGNPGGGIHAFKDNSAAISRWEKHREAYAMGFILGTPGLGPDDGDTAAWQAIGRKTAELLHQAKSARGFAELLNAAARYLDVDKEHAHASTQDTPQNELAMRLVDLLDRVLPRQDASVVDADSVE